LFQIPPSTVHTPKYGITDRDNKDNIMKLLNKPFCNVVSTERLEILRQGRPRPSLLIDEEYYDKDFNIKLTKFRIINYVETKWLTACSNTNRLYCWPCLLFNKIINKWNSGLGHDVNRAMFQKIRKHSNDTSHYLAVRKYNYYQNLVQLSTKNDIMNNTELANCEKLSDEDLSTIKTKKSGDTLQMQNYKMILPKQRDSQQEKSVNAEENTSQNIGIEECSTYQVQNSMEIEAITSLNVSSSKNQIDPIKIDIPICETYKEEETLITTEYHLDDSDSTRDAIEESIWEENTAMEDPLGNTTNENFCKEDIIDSIHVSIEETNEDISLSLKPEAIYIKEEFIFEENELI
jgi:hypothetical protein